MKAKFAIFFVFLTYSLVFAFERYKVPIDNSPQRGPKDAPVAIIEFLDFQ
jgi:hypothetical protein